jgi:prepilin-type N-terminal cleavage/methylation domain-containing protein
MLLPVTNPNAPSTAASQRKVDAVVVARSQAGFNLIELLISLSIATVLFMAIVSLFVKQGEVMNNQTAVLDMQREARFGMEHLTRDLQSLGSNSTPNSANDPLVCPKPPEPLRALTLSLTGGYVVAPERNPNVRPVSLRLFGTLEVKTRWKTAGITGNKVTFYDDGTLPTSESAWTDTFSTDKFLRISSADGKQMYFGISSSNYGERSVSVTEEIPKQETTQPCGYSGFGNNLWVDVQNFVRYRVIADERPGSPTLADGTAAATLLVRERLGQDGVTLVGQLPLVENVVDMSVFDIAVDLDPASDVQKIKIYPLVEDVVTKENGGILGDNGTARPEAVRFLTVKISVRSAEPVQNLTHTPRDVVWQPLETWQLSTQTDSAHTVITTATRIAMPTLVSRNL